MVDKVPAGKYNFYWKYVCIGLHNAMVMIVVDDTASSLPLCSREGGTAVPDEIEVVACSVYCVCAVQKCCKQLLNAQH